MVGDWRSLDLCGATRISRIVSVYEVFEMRLPGALYKIKVLEHSSTSFSAHANVGLKGPDGFSAAGAGAGSSEMEALEDFLRFFSDELSVKSMWECNDLIWVDPAVF